MASFPRDVYEEYDTSLLGNDYIEQVAYADGTSVSNLGSNWTGNWEALAGNSGYNAVFPSAIGIADNTAPYHRAASDYRSSKYRAQKRRRPIGFRFSVVDTSLEDEPSIATSIVSSIFYVEGSEDGQNIDYYDDNELTVTEDALGLIASPSTLAYHQFTEDQNGDPLTKAENVMVAVNSDQDLDTGVPNTDLIVPQLAVEAQGAFFRTRFGTIEWSFDFSA
jgi:hypothetical protein